MTSLARRHAWDAALVVLLAGSVAVMFWHEETEVQAQKDALELVDLALVAVFLGDWLWRAAKAPQRGRFALAHSWELLGMVPLMLPAPGVLRFLRLARLVRILRVFGRVGEALGTWERIARESQIAKIAAISGSITLVGSFLVWLIEKGHHPDHPELDQYVEWLWWAIVTVTTVGYGDVTPVTPVGRVIAGGLMVTGIGTIGLLASSVASVLVTRKDAEAPAPAAAPPALAGAFVAELQALAALHESGKLSDAEFAAAKARLLR